jgi:hypothetical protein
LSRDTLSLRADFCVFFRRVGPGVVSLSQRVLTWFPCPGTDTLCLHQTRIEALSPWRWRVQQDAYMGCCGLETSLCPRTVLCKEVAERRRSPVRLRLGGGAAHVNLRRLSPSLSEPERLSKQSAGLRVNGLCALSVRNAVQQPCLEHAVQAHPACVQLGIGLTRSAPS